MKIRPKNVPFTALLGMCIVFVYAITVVFAPLIAPFGETEIVGSPFLPWSLEHPFGTDNLGRDMLTRLIFGARNSVGLALATTVLAFVIGTSTGFLAAIMGGWVDAGISRSVDVLMAIPALIFALLLLTISGPSLVAMVLIVSVIEGTRVFRLTRAVAGNLVVMEFVESAQLRGESLWWIIRRELLPNATAPLAAELGLRFCFVFLFISALSFLGLGIRPPLAEWGSMVRENATLITYGDVTPLLPAAAIAILTIGVNFIVDWFLHVTSGLED
jgi:peptide/nickel transport system permease protein